MKPYVLASSSEGNCYIFDFKIGNHHTLLMVECGIPIKQIFHKCNQEGIMVSNIEACLITHAHKDHCCSAKQIDMMGIPIYAHKDTLERINVRGNELILNEFKRVANGIAVAPFEVEHDIEGACGFVIKTKYETVIFINDCKTWKTDLINFKPDYVFIECNYNHKVVHMQYEVLRKELEFPERYSPSELKEKREIYNQRARQINAHMSLAGTLKNLENINLNHCKAIFLMHLSPRFSNEYVMKNEVQAKFGLTTKVCMKNGGIK